MLITKLAKSICITVCIYFLQTNISTAQPGAADFRADTLRLEFTKAEKMFLDSNLQLLAQRYNIQSAKALTEQAKKWDNPILNTDQNLYTSNGFFRHTTDANGNPEGEVFIQVLQLIKTAGKRGKQTDLARINEHVAEWQFKAVMRNLRAILYKDFYTVAQLQSKQKLYDEQLSSLNKLNKAQEQELKAGNIARKEYLRVQALIISLKQDMTANAKDIADNESELKTILRLRGNAYVVPQAPETESTGIAEVSLPQLLDSARHNNTDYMQENQQLAYNRQNYKLQKALAVPDLTVGTEFDQSANYAPNYFGLALSLPLPLWDRNQGNIKAAKFTIKQHEALLTDADIKLDNEVMNAWQKLMLSIKQASEDNNRFYADYYQLQKNITESFNNRQISMIEFLDYFNDYLTVKQKELQQTLDLRLAKQELNDVVGIDIIK